MKRQKGFTLIELMVVIVILGILAAVIAPRIPDLVKKAKEGKTKGNLSTLRSTLNIYYGDTDGRYPTDDLSCLVPNYIKMIPEMETASFRGKPNTHTHSASSKVTKDTVANGWGVDDAGGWLYEDTESESDWGDVIVNCSGVDSSGKGWSTY